MTDDYVVAFKHLAVHIGDSGKRNFISNKQGFWRYLYALFYTHSKNPLVVEFHWQKGPHADLEKIQR